MSMLFLFLKFLLFLLLFNSLSTIQPLQPPPSYSSFVRNSSDRFKPSSYCKTRCSLIREVNLDYGESPLGFTTTNNITEEQATALKSKLKKTTLSNTLDQFYFEGEQLLTSDAEFMESAADSNAADSIKAQTGIRRPPLQTLQRTEGGMPEGMDEDPPELQEPTPDGAAPSDTSAPGMQRPRFRTRKSIRVQKQSET